MDSDLWNACAGPFAQLPAINSAVFYFPQGHAEHGNFPSASLPGVPPFICCRVSAVERAADPKTDEVFAKISLVPTSFPTPNVGGISNHVGGGLKEKERNPNGVIWCAKVLTQSDANNGGGFSVPKVCADKIFPSLDFSADPPVQEIYPKDIHGGAWKFRHIYRGTPRRHLLTSGWSVFVNKKSLVAGDALIFMRKEASPEIGVGIRRDRRRQGGEPPRIRPEDVVEAVRLAVAGRPFEVVYDPCRSRTEFLVKADVAMEGIFISVRSLRVGTKVEVEVEDKSDFSKKKICSGTVAKLQEHDPNWPFSPWRVVQVKLDEEEGEGEGEEENLSHFNPWSITVQPEFELPEFTGHFPVALIANSSEPNHRQVEEEVLALVPVSDSTAVVVAEEPKLAYENVTNGSSSDDVTRETEKNDDNKKIFMLFGKVIEVAPPVDKAEIPPTISSSLAKLPTDHDTSPQTPEVNDTNMKLSSDKMTSHPRKKRTAKKLVRTITASIANERLDERKRKKEDSV